MALPAALLRECPCLFPAPTYNTHCVNHSRSALIYVTQYRNSAVTRWLNSLLWVGGFQLLTNFLCAACRFHGTAVVRLLAPRIPKPIHSSYRIQQVHVVVVIFYACTVQSHFMRGKPPWKQHIQVKFSHKNKFALFQTLRLQWDFINIISYGTISNSHKMRMQCTLEVPGHWSECRPWFSCLFCRDS
jgi:hypothetical protein